MGLPTGDDVQRESGVVSGRKSGVFLTEDGLLTPRAAVVAWVGTVVLIVVALSSVMWGWPLPLDGSGNTVAPMSISSDRPASAPQKADKQMSGRFEVGENGKLLRPSDAPIPMQPLLPPAAHQETPEGMEAFAKYVINLIPYTWMSGNTTPLENISLPDCSWCRAVVGERQRLNERIGWVENAKIEVTAASRAIEVPNHPGLWHIELSLHHDELHGYDGNKIFQRDSFDEVLIIQARYENTRWMLWDAGAGEER